MRVPARLPGWAPGRLLAAMVWVRQLRGVGRLGLGCGQSGEMTCLTTPRETGGFRPIYRDKIDYFSPVPSGNLPARPIAQNGL